jgi:hypothetical protein
LFKRLISSIWDRRLGNGVGDRFSDDECGQAQLLNGCAYGSLVYLVATVVRADREI